MQRKIPSVFLVVMFINLCSSISGVDIDFGGSLENDTMLGWIPTFSPYQRDKLSAWFLADFNELLSISAQLSYAYTTPFPVIFDVDYLELSGTIPRFFGETSLVNFSVGRFFFSDFSGAVFSHTMDGIFADVTWPFLSVSTAVGFTGLVLKPVSGISLSRTDILDKADSARYLGAPRLIESVEAVFPELLLRQTLTVALLFQQDLRPADRVAMAGGVDELPDSGGHVHTQYYGLGISGPILPFLYYDASAYLQTGSSLVYAADTESATGFSYQRVNAFAFFGELGVQAYFSQLLSSQIDMTFRTGTGDGDFSTYMEGNTEGDANVFTPVTNPSSGYIFSPQLGNMTSIQMSYGIKPLEWIDSVFTENLQIVLAGGLLFRTVVGPISVPGINPASTSRFLGAEIDLTFNYRPFSDLGAAIGMGLFIPNNSAETGALSADTWGTSFIIRLQLFFSF